MSEWTITTWGYIPRSPNAQGRQHFGRKLDERCFWRAVIGSDAWYQGIPPASHITLQGHPLLLPHTARGVFTRTPGSNAAGIDYHRKVRRVRFELHKVSKRPRDIDNLHASLKHVLDAMVGEGLLVDDSPEWMIFDGVEEVLGAKSYATVIHLSDVH